MYSFSISRCVGCMTAVALAACISVISGTAMSASMVLDNGASAATASGGSSGIGFDITESSTLSATGLDEPSEFTKGILENAPDACASIAEILSLSPSAPLGSAPAPQPCKERSGF